MYIYFCIFVKLGESILGTSGGRTMFCECLPQGGVENIQENLSYWIFRKFPWMDGRILWYCSIDLLSGIPPGMGFDFWF